MLVEVRPGLEKRRLMLLDKPRNTVQLVLSETTIRHERNRIEPEFGHLPITLHRDMRWFSPIGTEENKAVGSNA
jgi:hypothetical protein